MSSPSSKYPGRKMNYTLNQSLLLSFLSPKASPTLFTWTLAPAVSSSSLKTLNLPGSGAHVIWATFRSSSTTGESCRPAAWYHHIFLRQIGHKPAVSVLILDSSFFVYCLGATVHTPLPILAAGALSTNQARQHFPLQSPLIQTMTTSQHRRIHAGGSFPSIFTFKIEKFV